MDENEMQQYINGDDADLSQSIDESSFIGKMKFGVSKILPNSLSKWLSPKVDKNNGRRRRHEEIESDDSDVGQNTSTVHNTLNESRNNCLNYQNAQKLVPPTKRQRTTLIPTNQNAFDSYSRAGNLLGERSNIVSSTLIEDVALPPRTTEFNSGLENGQHTPSRDEQDLDEGSSSQSREKFTNPFMLNNDSSVVNFSAHLQRAKSLFTNRSYVSQKLKNYRMRNPRSSLYRSTSSLCDNNSVSSNASSAMSSPFYNGQTTFGGASATSRRLNSTMQTDLQLQSYHRPKIPTNLVASKSTSSLNTINGSAKMSTTARRILDVMNKYSTPLTEVRRISNALPSIAESSILNKRKSILELDASLTGNEADKTKRVLLKPNTPYNRPFGRNPIDSVLTTELHVPSMPELLQLKKFATSTMQIREIANKSDNVLNKLMPIQSSDPKPTKSTNSNDGDLDVSNNNKKIINNNNEVAQIGLNHTAKPHKNKMRTNLTKRQVGKSDKDDIMPEPVKLPNITLQMDEKTVIKFPEPFKLNNVEQKLDKITNNGSIKTPFEFKGTLAANASTVPEKQSQTSDNETHEKQTAENSKKIGISFLPSSKKTMTTICPSLSSSTFEFNSKQPAQSISKLPKNTFASFQFSEPIFIGDSINSIGTLTNNTGFKFSEPVFIGTIDDNEKINKVSNIPSVNFKFESNTVTGITGNSGIVDKIQPFGSMANKTTNIFSTNSNIPRSEPDKFARDVASAPTQSTSDLFKTVTAQQKQNKWECSACMVSNDDTVSKCVCCQTERPNKKDITATVESTKSATVDDAFKTLVSKQKDGKWECNSCLTQNDKSKTKCVCCDALQPNCQTSSDNVESVPQKSFTFGSTPVTTFTTQPLTASDNTFKSIVAKQKSSTWVCSECTASNNLTVSTCVCCNHSRDSTSNNSQSNNLLAKPASSQFSFGTQGSIGSVSSQFSFGSKSNNINADPFAAPSNTLQGQFSFGSSSKNEETSTTTINNKIEENKNKEQSTNLASSNTFSFGSTTKLTPINTHEANTSKPVAPVSTAENDIFKKIVADQNSKWECKSCMIKNEVSHQKCVACGATNELGTTSDLNKGAEISSKPSFSFGSAVNTSNSLTFGSKMGNVEEKAPAQSIFGSISFSKPSSTIQFGSSINSSSTVAASTSNIFGIQSSSSAFSSPLTKSSTDNGSSNFKFSLGSSAIDTKVNMAPIGNSSNDVTDSISSSSKPSTFAASSTANPLASNNGPLAPKGIFSFGSTSGSTSALNTTAVSHPPSITPATQSTQNLFGSTTTTNAFQIPQPTLSAPNFSFGSNSAASPTANATPNPPVFGSNSFGSSATPSLGGFKTNSFGTSSIPSFNTINQSTSLTEVKQPVLSQPSAGLFKFGGNNENVSSVNQFSNEPPKLGGFNFTPNAAPSFNFSQQPIQQPNVPFQFGATPDAQPNLFAVQPSSTMTAIQQRKKLRPIKRTNRP